MENKVNKAIIIGVDAAIPELVKKFIEEGSLPNIRNLVEQGVWGENCLVPFPTITPPNWTTIATGAYPGTHGITCFTVHHPGEPLDKIYTGFNSKECTAEYLWNAAEKVGKRSILIKWPASWPPTLKDGIQIDGCHPHECIHEIDVPHLFVTDGGYPLATPISPVKAEGWEDSTQSKLPPLETQIELGSIKRREIVGRILKDEYYEERLKLWVLVTSSNGYYDTVSIFRDKSSEPIAILHKGEWSDWIKELFNGNNGKREGLFKIKVLDLSENGSKLKLYTTHISPREGYSYPEEIAREITENIGPFPIEPGWFGITRGWFDESTFLEIVDWQNSWYAEAAKYLTGKYNWDILFIQTHCIDFAQHVYLSRAEPLTASSKEESEYYLNVLRKAYQSVDRMIGAIISNVGKDALTFVVSDHGSVSHIGNVPIAKILQDAGLLFLKEDPITHRTTIDWSNTKAIPQRSVYIYVNLKGRDPDGIVNQEEYESVRDTIIDALYSYKDPTTGKRPILFALRREDARILGLYGDRIGDIVYAVRPEYGHEHGQQVTTARFGFGSLKGLFIASGPGIKRGVTIARNISLADIAPTISYVLDIPGPMDSEGRILHEIFSEPYYKLREVKELKEELQRWRIAYEKQLSIDHNLTI